MQRGGFSGDGSANLVAGLAFAGFARARLRKDAAERLTIARLGRVHGEGKAFLVHTHGARRPGMAVVDRS